MESYMQKLAKKKEPAAVTILPVFQEKAHEHDAACADGSCGCGESEGGCCGG